jgi:DNA-binding NarL/FixJ family response regulator
MGGNQKMNGSSDAVVAVLDASGAIYEVVRRACPDIPLRRLTTRIPTNGSRPSLAILAVYGPNDWRRAARCSRGMPTVVVVQREAPEDAARARLAGAFGLLNVGLSADALRRAVMGAMSGEPAYSRAALGEHIKAERLAILSDQFSDLTPRQRQIVGLIARGASDREIGRMLGITTSTTQKHVQALLRRLEVPNRAAAVAAMLGRGTLAIARSSLPSARG